MDSLHCYRDRYLEYCTVNRRLLPTTIKGYQYNLDNFILFLENLDPAIICWTQVRRKHLDEYLDLMSEKYSVKTIKGRFSTIRSFFSFLINEGLIVENPFKRFRIRMQDAVRVPNSMTLCEVESILKEAYGSEDLSHFIKLRDILVLELLFCGGMRVSELCGICVSAFNPSEETLQVKGKSDKDRIIFITNKDVIALLHKYLAVRNSLMPEHDALLLSSKMKPLSTAQARHIVTRYVKAAGITKRVGPHTFRHTFASLLLEEGVNIKYIQEFLGHSSIKTTQIYLHTSNARKKEILNEMHPRKRLGPK